MGFHRGGFKCQLDGLGVGATAAAAIRGRRSGRGGSRSGLRRLAYGLVESQCDFEFCGTTHRARAEETAFPDHEVYIDVLGLAAAAVVHLNTHLQVHGHEYSKWPWEGAILLGQYSGSGN